MTYRMRDGSEVEDPRLGRLVQFDERSRGFGIAARVSDLPIKPKGWSVRWWLDQRREGACVSFAQHHDAVASPARSYFPSVAVAERLAMERYQEMKRIDPWPGEDYDGTSVLAGAKVMQSLGYFKEYRWAFSLDDVLRALSNEGPVILGTNWYEGMYDVDAEGYVHPTGEVVGGHSFLLSSVSPGYKRVRIWNSWGADWGFNGRANLSFDSLEQLLHESGEALVPVDRQIVLAT
jgi:hypothetical protein